MNRLTKLFIKPRPGWAVRIYTRIFHTSGNKSLINQIAKSNITITFKMVFTVGCIGIHLFIAHNPKPISTIIMIIAKRLINVILNTTEIIMP
jgi:hypothetical protein